MNTSLSVEQNKFHPLQWIEVYGVFSNRCDYIVTCQAYQLQTALKSIRLDWWDDLVLQPITEEEIEVEMLFSA